MSDISIMLVDDSATMRKIEKVSLSKIGFQNVTEATNGSEALDKLKDGKPDLILCDWNMPEMNGLQFVNAVRNDPNLQSLPIIMLTTVNTREEVLAVIKAGANDFLNKPFTPEALNEKIAKVLARQ
jgi:two-component system chemotaxis response regulator CheY